MQVIELGEKLGRLAVAHKAEFDELRGAAESDGASARASAMALEVLQPLVVEVATSSSGGCSPV